jgi:WD40 repeat protein
LAFSPDGKTIASVDGYFRLRLWEALSGKERSVLKTGKVLIDAVCFSPDGKTLATGSGGDDGVALWDLVSLKRITPEQESFQEIASQVTFSPDGKTVALASWCSGRLELWNVATGKRAAVFKEPRQAGGGSEVVAFTGDGRTLMSWGERDGLEQWDVASGKRTAAINVGRDAGAVALTQDGKLFAAVENDQDKRSFEVRLWDIAAEKELSKFAGRGCLDRLMFSRDGKTLAAGDDRGTVTTWDVATGNQRMQLDGLGQPVRLLGLSPDGTVVATGQQKVIKHAAYGRALRRRAVPATGPQHEVIKLWEVLRQIGRVAQPNPTQSI